MYKYIMTVVIVLMGLLQFTSCDDANDWTVDSSVLKQYPPTSLKVDVDLKTHMVKGSIGAISGVASYEIQMSKSPLSSNASIPVEGEVFTATFEKSEETGDISLADGGFPRLEENTTYYFRVRAIGKDGSISNWYTNGSLYNGGVTDAALEKKLIEHTYAADGDKNSVCCITVPPIMWETDVDEDYVTVRWHEIKFAKITTLRVETPEGEKVGQDVDVSSEDPLEETYSEDDDTKLYEKTIDGLDLATNYVVSLLDEEGDVITKVNTATENTPDMNLAMSVTKDKLEKERFMTKGVAYPVTSDEVGGRTFSVTFNNESAGGWTADRNDYVANPVKKAIKFNARAQLKKKNTVTIKVPCKGRLYIYGYNKTTLTASHVDSGGDKVTDWEITTSTTKQKIPTVEDESVVQNAYMSYHKRINVVNQEVTLTIGSESFYFYGFCFVPDDPNAGQEQ